MIKKKNKILKKSPNIFIQIATRPNKKAKVDLKIYDVIYREKNNYGIVAPGIMSRWYVTHGSLRMKDVLSTSQVHWFYTNKT